MTIIGIGTDLVNIERIDGIIARYGDRFLNRVFCLSEIVRGKGKRTASASFAKNFAAKEAILKALGTGLARGISWQDIEIKYLASGQPYALIKNEAQQHLQNLLLPDHKAVIHLSLSDDYPWAQAFAIIEGCPQEVF